ncbi:type II toxin-antitoxin system HicA family toxin [Solidesulfovibrio sp. C21]|uniref:type II toxin-antitoxin system HicA family toxin n=1 Tax=Solidesulfovibrio sp. C21 TaxID=3398613 RepID=UPI0039FC3360
MPPSPPPSPTPLPVIKLNSVRLRTWQALFTAPPRSDIAWNEVIALIRALGGRELPRRQKTAGSRVRFLLGGVKGFFHRPHPENVLGKGCAVDVREFLIRAGMAGQDQETA